MREALNQIRDIVAAANPVAKIALVIATFALGLGAGALIVAAFGMAAP